MSFLSKILGAAGLVGAGGGGGNITVRGSVSGQLPPSTTLGAKVSVSLASLSLAEDDVMIAIAAADDDLVGGDQHLAIDLLATPGWVPCSPTMATPAPDGHWWMHRCGSSPPTAVDVFRPYNTSANNGVILIQAYRGVDARVFDALASAFATGVSVNPNPPAITTSANNALVVAGFMLDDDATTMDAVPSGYGDGVSASSGTPTLTTNHVTVGMASKLKETAGAEDPGAFTVGSVGDEWTGFTLSLRPDADVVSGWAIQLVGGVGNIVHTQIPGNGGNVNVPLPAGLQENDLVVVLATAYDDWVGGTPTDPILSSGWDTEGFHTGSQNVWWGVKKMSSTPDTIVQMDDPANSFIDASVLVLALRGVDTTTPKDVAAAFASGTPTCPTITTVTNNTLVGRVFFGNGDLDAVWNWPLGYAWHQVGATQIRSSGDMSTVSVCFTQQNTAGATGTVTMNATNTPARPVAMTMAFRPA